jgi:hypothetical protein
MGSVFYAPSIPHEKLRSARAAHALHLPEEEPILVLYDGTLFGGAKDGFVVTPQRLCWKNLWDHPRQIPWSDLEPSAIARGSGKIGVAGGGILILAELVPGAAAFFMEMASWTHFSQASPYRTADLPKAIGVDAVIATERLLSLTRTHVGEVDDLYLHPSIPAAKLAHASEVHADHLPAEEVVAVLFDDTVFGSAEEGFLFTSQRLCWKNLSTDPKQLPYRDIALDTITAHESHVGVMDAELELTGRNELVGPVAKLIRVIVEEVQGSPRE